MAPHAESVLAARGSIPRIGNFEAFFSTSDVV
ncbi:hypothetical protein EYZ11_005755 [Aspergillus tanneri]|uniref:Uncharacterized protein n=1 Tax=Aspergillus tanneri TaxID=1220188 RepID=A0A4S3JHC0_9EURO|nr:hypothetical protein EYZ11_005755 [Aspergillus tanneri]